jgi:nitroreductase
MRGSEAAPLWAQTTNVVADALKSRRAIRAFLETPISHETICEILTLASRSPSGTNTQPWRVYVLTGACKESLTKKIDEELNQESIPQTGREIHYPTKWDSPYIERRRKVGWDLYGLLKIKREDRDLIAQQRNKNFSFYGAPVGLIFSIDKRLKAGSWLDYGMFLQSIMLASRAQGLATCPQAAFTQFSDQIASHLGFSENELLVCGMALGYADPKGLVNTLETEREPVEQFASFHGWSTE